MRISRSNTDSNIYVSGVLGSVATVGVAYNLLEGNHSLNLAAAAALFRHADR